MKRKNAIEDVIASSAVKCVLRNMLVVLVA